MFFFLFNDEEEVILLQQEREASSQDNRCLILHSQTSLYNPHYRVYQISEKRSFIGFPLWISSFNLNIKHQSLKLVHSTRLGVSSKEPPSSGRVASSKEHCFLILHLQDLFSDHQNFNISD